MMLDEYSFKQTNIVPGGGGGGKSSGKSTIIQCHYKSYEGDLKNSVSVILPTNFGEDCSLLTFNFLLYSKLVQSKWQTQI